MVFMKECVICETNRTQSPDGVCKTCKARHSIYNEAEMKFAEWLENYRDTLGLEVCREITVYRFSLPRSTMPNKARAD